MSDSQGEANRIPLSDYRALPAEEMEHRAVGFHAEMRRRRSVREFSEQLVSRSVIENCLRAAGTAPSGANRQPWHFFAVSDSQMKKRIRLAAEQVEKGFYEERAPQPWLDDLAPLGTSASKPFLERASHLIVVFAKHYEPQPNGSRAKTYYPTLSVGIATGMLITAIHHAGLVCLPYTPSPADFLAEIFEVPEGMRPLLILATGYPAEDATVPDIRKKPLDQIATFL